MPRRSSSARGGERRLAGVAAPEGPRQVEIASPLGRPSRRLEQQVAQEEAEVHRRVALVGGFVIDQREAVFMVRMFLGL